MRERQRQERAASWLPLVEAFIKAYDLGQGLSGGGRRTAAREEERAVSPPDNGGKRPTLLLCSPHPDDEVLTGALPLRLLREQGARVINLAMTLGTDPSRQSARWQELAGACAVVGFECQRFFAPPGFELKAGAGGKGWSAAVKGLVELFEGLHPNLVFFPHGQDHHPAHVETHRLVCAALAMFTARQTLSVKAVETEYWRPMAAPNLLVGVSAEDLARLLAAVVCHRGEIARNPYHLTCPARLMDCVRRGAEMVRSPTPARPDFIFADLYRLSVWRHGRRRTVTLADGWFGPDQGLERLLA